MNFELRQRLERVARRIRSFRLWTALAFCWLAWAAVGLVVFELAASRSMQFDWTQLATLAAVSALACVFAVRFSARDQRTVARRIEARHPELGTLLLAAIEQAAAPRERLGYLQTSVIRDAVEHGRHHHWPDAVSPWKLRLAKLASFTALGLLIGVCVGLANRAGAHGSSAGLLPTFGGGLDSNFEIEVDPGNTEIERGTSLVVVAQFPLAVPPDATLVFSDDTDSQQAQDMSRSLDDPKFVGRIASVDSDLSYHVEFATRRSETYRVTVFEYPELIRADARLIYPDYASLEPSVIEDVRHITAVEGTKLTLAFRLNKEVAKARLVGTDGRNIDLKRDAKDATLYRVGWTLDESRRFKLALVDREGRSNRLPPEIVVNVTPNRPPKIVMDRPARDVDVSPLEELQLKATVSDDFGVAKSGLSYALGGAPPQEITLTAGSATEKQQVVEHLLDFEALQAEPDQLVSYFLWAEDAGPDGQPRRTSSDMYFAEVRPFEEIYRQGEQQAQNQQQQQQGQGGNSQQAAELAELQKQIINATWKLVRRETAPETTAEFPVDSRLVEESQQAALERLSALAERLEDSESLAHVETARSHMNEALTQLSSATDKRVVAPLRPALSAEQAAYQALLKLRAREHQVVRGGQQQPGGGARGGSASQRQLDQLELSADENRYETQSRATNPEETQAQRESREIFDRLRDLARRQEDLNERLRELQSALQQAQTAQERAELERELKRLRDQQQEILRDSDELIGRMERQGDQPQAQEARRQMEESRSHVQQASEALEQGQLSQAVTEGTRAGRQLSELRDQFRQQAANRFSEEMTEMRRAARELEQQQQRLSEQLNQQQIEPGRSLRDSGSRAEVAEGLAEQNQDLRELLDRMRQTIEEAEEPEPLLSKQLYDTVREAHHQRVENAIDVARRLVDVGIEREAGQAMRAADEGIGRLREGVERAAESVLGDETEALRRAQREVDRLAEELNREIGAAQGDDRADAGSQPPGEEANSPSNRPGNRQNNNNNNNNNRRQDPSARGEAERPQEGRGQPGQSSQENNTDGEQPAQDGQSPEGGARPSDEDQREGGNQPASEAQGGRGQNERQRSSLRGGGRDSNQGGLQQLLERGGGGGGAGGPGGPITGDDFRDWADRLRDVEQMLEDQQLRSDAARIRDRAQDARLEFKRQSKQPNWIELQQLVAEPLVELGRRIDEEIRRQESPDALVPIDRDPIPPEFAEQVRRYYERLGSGE